MATSIDSRNRELAHAARNPRDDISSQYIGSKSRLFNQLDAYIGYAKSRHAICDFIEKRERADILLRARLMIEEPRTRRSAT